MQSAPVRLAVCQLIINPRHSRVAAVEVVGAMVAHQSSFCKKVRMSMKQTKTARITAARAIDIVCETCNELCVDLYGSTMITSDSTSVTCNYCDTKYKIPANAFSVVCRVKCFTI